jgi:hypothetical protein
MNTRYENKIQKFFGKPQETIYSNTKVNLCEIPVGLVSGLDHLAQEKVQLDGGGEAGRCSRKSYNETSCSMKGRKKRTS